jgi:uroporphyrin-III C-methyltransferase
VTGRVLLVGAGPGDPELITVKGAKALAAADVVVYDRLAAAALLDLTPATAERIYVGKQPGGHAMRQEEINEVLVDQARLGRTVVRLKGGDPFVFGRGAEEALALAMAGIAFEVVPGVSSAIAAPELAGIPVTHRGSASGFLVLSGHATDAFENGLKAVQPNAVSLVVLMGLGSRHELAEKLIARGWNGATPAAIVCGASTPDEWVWTGTIAELGANEPPAGIAGVVVIGDVVRVRERLGAAEEQKVMYGRNR